MLIRKLKEAIWRIKLLTGDGGYREELIDKAKTVFNYVLQIVMRKKNNTFGPNGTLKSTLTNTFFPEKLKSSIVCIAFHLASKYRAFSDFNASSFQHAYYNHYLIDESTWINSCSNMILIFIRNENGSMNIMPLGLEFPKLQL